MFLAHIQVAEHLQRVVDRLHPGIQFFFQGTGQETEFLAHRNRRARDHQPAVFTVVHGLLQSRRHGQQGLPGAGLAHQRHQLHALVQQRVEGEMLLAIARSDPPHPFARVGDGDQSFAGAIDFRQRRALGIRLLGQRAVLVRKVRVFPVQLEGTDLAERRQFFRGHREFEHSRVEVLYENAIGLVILGLQPQRVGFDAEVDVLGDEDRPLPGLTFLNRDRQGDDPAVHGVVADGDVAVAFLVLENDPEPSAVGQADPFAQSAPRAQTVEGARNGAGVRAAFG